MGLCRNSGTEDAWTVQGIARMPDDILFAHPPSLPRKPPFDSATCWSWRSSTRAGRRGAPRARPRKMPKNADSWSSPAPTVLVPAAAAHTTP